MLSGCCADSKLEQGGAGPQLLVCVEVLCLAWVCLLFVFDKGSLCSPGWPCVAQAGLEFEILLPLPPECLGYRHVLPWLAYMWYFEQGCVLLH